MEKTEAENMMKNVKNLEMVAPSIPGPIYWKNKNGIYLGVNRFALEASGLKTFSNFVGKTDQDLWPRFACEIIENDHKVMQTGQTIEEEGAISLPNGEIKYYTAVKIPLRDDKNNIIGIIGNYVDTTNIVASMKKVSNTVERITQLASNHQSAQNRVKMSNRELDCLRLLKEGLSSKQIAVILNISKRTVEQYIDTAKNKLDCKNSVELIYKCFRNRILQ